MQSYHHCKNISHLLGHNSNSLIGKTQTEQTNLKTCKHHTIGFRTTVSSIRTYSKLSRAGFFANSREQESPAGSIAGVCRCRCFANIRRQIFLIQSLKPRTPLYEINDLPFGGGAHNCAHVFACQN